MKTYRPRARNGERRDIIVRSVSATKEEWSAIDQAASEVGENRSVYVSTAALERAARESKGGKPH